MQRYQLPNAADAACSDPLSLLDSPEDRVPQWGIIEATLRLILLHHDPSSQFEEALANLAYTLHGEGAIDNGILLKVIADLRPAHNSFIKSLVLLSLRLPALFPNGTLTILRPSTSTVTFSRRQLTCLVAHQTLGTLTKPPWMDWSGPNLRSSWFARDETGSGGITEAYTRVLVQYLLEEFSEHGRDSIIDDAITFSLRTAHHEPDFQSSRRLCNIEVISSPEADDEGQGMFTARSDHRHCLVVAANRMIGFGSAGELRSSLIHPGSPLILPHPPSYPRGTNLRCCTMAPPCRSLRSTSPAHGDTIGTRRHPHYRPLQRPWSFSPSGRHPSSIGAANRTFIPLRRCTRNG